MSASGLVGMFRVPDAATGPGATMALADHLRELRARLLRVVVVLVLAMALALVFYDQFFDLIYGPYRQAQEALEQEVQSTAVIKGVAGPLLLQLKVSGIAALVGTSPYWLYQLWAFILPGLHPHERRWTRLFVAVAGPLFLLGVVVAYYVLPRGLEVLIGFTQADLENLVEFGEYFTFFTRMLLVFGVAFEIPVFVVMLNLVGVLPGKTLGAYRAWVILGTFVFAAAATPSTDPFSMLMLALPMTLLFLLSEVVARLMDRRRARTETSYDALSDDEASILDDRLEEVTSSDLDEPD